MITAWKKNQLIIENFRKEQDSEQAFEWLQWIAERIKDYYDAQDDTAMALREARNLGIHPFCITVDPEGKHYLAQMYGEVGYTVISRVESLPTRLPLIYRRLTR